MVGGGLDGVANIDYCFNEHGERKKKEKEKAMKSQESNVTFKRNIELSMFKLLKYILQRDSSNSWLPTKKNTKCVYNVI